MSEDRDTLANQAKALTGTIEVLASAVDQLERRSTRSERMTIAVAFGLGLDLVLSVAVALLVNNLFGVNTQLQTTIDREAITRQEVLCPFYGLLLGSYNPSTRAEGADRDSYVRAFVTLRAGYDRLSCVNPIVPPRVDAPPATIPPR